MLHNSLEPDRTDDKTILNGILWSPNWTSILYKAVLTIGIGSACVIPLGKNRF